MVKYDGYVQNLSCLHKGVRKWGCDSCVLGQRIRIFVSTFTKVYYIVFTYELVVNVPQNLRISCFQANEMQLRAGSMFAPNQLANYPELIIFFVINLWSQLQLILAALFIHENKYTDETYVINTILRCVISKYRAYTTDQYCHTMIESPRGRFGYCTKAYFLNCQSLCYFRDNRTIFKIHDDNKSRHINVYGVLHV